MALAAKTSHSIQKRPSIGAERDTLGEAGTALKGSNDATAEMAPQTARNVNRYHEAVEQDHDLSVTPQSQELNFFDEEMWSAVFANAGFNISEGVFLQNTSSH